MSENVIAFGFEDVNGFEDWLKNQDQEKKLDGTKFFQLLMHIKRENIKLSFDQASNICKFCPDKIIYYLLASHFQAICGDWFNEEYNADSFIKSLGKSLEHEHIKLLIFLFAYPCAYLCVYPDIYKYKKILDNNNVEKILEKLPENFITNVADLYFFSCVCTEGAISKADAEKLLANFQFNKFTQEKSETILKAFSPEAKKIVTEKLSPYVANGVNLNEIAQTHQELEQENAENTSELPNFNEIRAENIPLLSNSSQNIHQCELQ